MQKNKPVASQDEDFELVPTIIAQSYYDEFSSASGFGHASNQALLETISSTLSSLTEQEERITRLYYGIDVDEAKKPAEIAKLLDISSEEVTRDRQKALRKLGHPSGTRRLRTFSNIDLHEKPLAQGSVSYTHPSSQHRRHQEHRAKLIADLPQLREQAHFKRAADKFSQAQALCVLNRLADAISEVPAKEGFSGPFLEPLDPSY